MALLDTHLIVHDEEASNCGLLIMMNVLPMMFTVLTPWNILVDEAAACGGCLSAVDWLGCCGGRRRVMNVRNLCRKSILVGHGYWKDYIVFSVP